MVNVKFEEPGFDLRPQATRGLGISKLVSFVLKLGLAKNERQANFVLIILAGVCFLLAILIPKWSGTSTPNSASNNIPQESLDQMPEELKQLFQI